MAKLNQIIAVENGEKTRAFKKLTDAYHLLQKTELLQGIARSYTPYEDGGETLPSESTRVQLRTHSIVTDVAEALTVLIDITATKDWANCDAKANVEVDGHVLLNQVPVTYLLFLEKKLVDIHTFVSKLPILGAAEVWKRDLSQDCWATDAVQTARTKKIPRNHVKAEATKEHPAQVELYHEDVRVGTWNTIKFSGAMQASEVRSVLDRVVKLQAAVKFAREQANNTDAIEHKVGERLFKFLLEGHKTDGWKPSVLMPDPE